jgi:putative MATE family efflux protein
MGTLLSPTILTWMKTPADVFDGATTYLRIYFLGTLAMLIYNSGSAILRALGNSKIPLYFLIVSSVVNIILDYIFVAVFHWNVAGVAWATLIANVVSSVLVIYVLLYRTNACPLEIRKIRINKIILTDMMKIGIPAGLQTFIVSISNTMVMSHVNSFGASAISGFTSANKFDNFLGLPLQSFSIAITTFVGQNLGAQKPERIKKGILWSVGLSFICILALGAPAYLLAENCIRIFIDDADVIRIGAQMMRTVIPFYVFLIFHQVLSGAVRGAGYTTMPMISAIFSFTFLRQIFLNTFMPSVQDVSLVFWSYALTWGVSGIIMLCYTLFGPWKKCLNQKTKTT